MMTIFKQITVSIIFLASVPGMAEDLPDYEREQRIAEQIEPDIFDGESVWLNANDHDFLAIHIPVENSTGAVIVMHGRDVNPEEQNVVGPLRVGLAEQGWTTLALQMPVLAKGKQYNDYLPILKFAHGRIEAAIQFLRDQGENTVILASHSCGAHMTNDWLNKVGDNRINGYIAIGLGATDIGQKLQTPFPIANMTVPVLDIYGSNEFPAPLSMVGERQAMLKQNGNPASTQIVVDGADHYFTDYGDILTVVIAEWLNQTTF